MNNTMEKLQRNLRMAFPKMPKEVFEKSKAELSLSYLNKCRKYFDFAKMYPVAEAISFPKPLERPVEIYRGL
jgi:hypothetical protein